MRRNRGRNHSPRKGETSAAQPQQQLPRITESRQRAAESRESAARVREFEARPPGAAREHEKIAGRESEVSGETSAQVYGVLPVLEALRAGSRPIEHVTLAEGVHENRLRELLELARRANVPVRRAPRAELQRMAAGANHQGVIANVAAAHYANADELLDRLTALKGTADEPLAIVLDGVEDPRNLGAIIRTAECAGAHGVFVPERRAVGLTETVAKAAAGALEYVPVARAANITRLVEELKERGIWTVGTAADAKSDYTEWDWRQPCALLLGGEGAGLRRLVKERCDVLVRIPLRGRISSLNVSVAAAVVLYEAIRQRTATHATAYKPERKADGAGE